MDARIPAVFAMKSYRLLLRELDTACWATSSDAARKSEMAGAQKYGFTFSFLNGLKSSKQNTKNNPKWTILSKWGMFRKGLVGSSVAGINKP